MELFSIKIRCTFQLVSTIGQSNIICKVFLGQDKDMGNLQNCNNCKLHELHL